MSMNSSIIRKVIRNKADFSSEQDDIIAVEQRLRILVNGKEILSLFFTPTMVRELVVGMLMTENIIRGGWCAERMTIEYGEDVLVDVPAEGEVHLEDGSITSGCIGGFTFIKRLSLPQTDDPFTISSDRLKQVFRHFQNASALYHETGCVHSAALSDGKSILCLAEDIGRHNAVDKVIGYAILECIPFEGKIMLASGRLSSEIVSKCAKWSIPVVASRTSPTSLAVDIAERSGITVVGFVRADRFNVYTGMQRIA